MLELAVKMIVAAGRLDVRRALEELEAPDLYLWIAGQAPAAGGAPIRERITDPTTIESAFKVFAQAGYGVYSDGG